MKRAQRPELRALAAAKEDLAFIAANARSSIEHVELACERFRDRPCLGARAFDPATERWLPRFDTLDFGEVRTRVAAFASGAADWLGTGTLAYNDMSGLGRSGTGSLKVDGKVVATQTMERTLPMILQWDESFDVGSDTLTGVNDADYQPPFTLTAKLNKLTLKVDRPKLSPEDIKKLEEGMKKLEAGKE